MLTEDFAQLNPRHVRDVLGQGTEPPLVTDTLEENVVKLSRSGWRNPVPVQRGTLQRVQYRLEEDELIREYWQVMDTPLGIEPRSETILDDVNEIEIEYLSDEAEWTTDWPPLNQLNSGAFVYPRAVRIRIELASWGEIERLVKLL